MYFITEPGFCQHFFGNIFEISEKERLFIHFSFIFYVSALLCEGLGDAEACLLYTSIEGKDRGFRGVCVHPAFAAA